MLLDCFGMRVGLRISAVVLLALVGCKKKSQPGLPPATDWQSGNAEVAQLQRPEAVQPPSDDPHAGMNMEQGQGPGLGEGDEDDTTGPLPPGHPTGAEPNTPAHATTSNDPALRIKGVLKVSPKLKDRLKPGAVVFLFVKTVGADGQPTGAPVAVDRLDWTTDGEPFELGSTVPGEVFVMARFDQDGDAMKPQPGDVTAQVKVKLPADKVELVLDTVVN